MKLKKWKSILIISTLIILLAGAYFLVFYKSYKNNASALDAIPNSAGLIVQIQSPYEAIPNVFKAEVWRFFDSVETFQQTKRNYFYLDTLLRSGEKTFELTQFATIYASAHQVNNKWEWLYTFNPSLSVSWQFLDQFILNANKGAAIEKIKNNKTEIHRIKLRDENNSSFYYTLHKNVFACSFNIGLIEKTITAINDKQKPNASFIAVQKTINPSAPVVLYIKQSAFASLFEPIIAYQNATTWENAKLFTNYSASEIAWKDNFIQFFGSTIADSSSYLLHQFTQAENRNFSSVELLPSNTFYFALYSAHADVFKNIEQETGIFRQVFNEIGVFSSYEKDASKCFDYVMITYSDAASKMEELLENQTPKVFFDDFTYGELSQSNELAQLPFSTISEDKSVFFTKVNDKLIFCENEEGLRSYLQKYTTKQFLQKNPVFQEYSATLAEKSALHLYLNTQEIPNERYFSEWKRDENNKKQFPVLGIQFARKSTIFSFNATFLFSDKIEQKSVKNWSVKLDAKPVFISDAQYDVAIQSSFVLVQDEQQNLYSIDHKGNVKWKRKIDGWMKESPTPVYFNGKTGGFTFIFNTEDKLYAIDNRGNDAKGFENGKNIKPEVAISVFKYEENIYRIFEITTERQVKIYDHTGKLVPGWKVLVLKDNLIMPVYYQNFAGKEHLIFMMQNGQILITDRQGNTILSKDSGFRISSENGVLVFNQDLSTSGWALTDDDGVFNIIYFDGKKKNDKITGYPKSKLFAYQPIKQGETKSVWLWDDKRIVLSNRSGNTQATFELLETSEKYPTIVSVAQKPFVELLSTSERKIYFLDTELSLIESFPKTYVGTAKLTDIHHDFIPELIIGEENNMLVCYTIAF